jgi:hypothetical protein
MESPSASSVLNFQFSAFCFLPPVPLGPLLSHLNLRPRPPAINPSRFGNAKLVKKLSGKVVLLGGSRDDRRAAREWCSLFLHEAVLAGEV